MRSLEEITRDLFTRYSERKTGRKAKWSRLSADRQADWLEDSYMILDYLLDEIEKEMDLKMPNKQPQASFEAGVLQGMRREHAKVETRLKDMREKYLTELQNFLQEWSN